MLRLLLALLALGIAGLAAAHAADVYVAPKGMGAEDGSSIHDAASFSKLNEMIERAGPGGRVLLRTDLGPYRARYFGIKTGGAPGSPVTLTGVGIDGEPALVEAVGRNRKRFFDLGDGADHLVFSGWRFSKVGEGAFYLFGARTGLTLERVDGTDLRNLVNMDGEASLTDFTFRGLTSSKFSKGFVQLTNASDGLIEDIDIDSAFTDGDPLPFGVHMDGVSHDVTIRNMRVRNLLNSAEGNPEKYWNGDGIALENDTFGVTIENVHVDGSSDSGFDLKGGTAERPHVVTDVSANNVKRGLRVWGVTRADGVTITNLALPSAVQPDGSVVTQTQSAGNTVAVWLREGAVLELGRVTIDGEPLTEDDIDIHGGLATVTPLQ